MVSLYRRSPNLCNYVVKTLFYERQRTKMLVLMSAVLIVYLLTDWLYLANIRAEMRIERWCNRSHKLAANSSWKRTQAGIPMLLHLVYRDTSMLEAYRANIKSCIQLNSNWTVILWTDDSVKLFISSEFPSLQSVFYRFKHKIQRSDAIRYLILYRFGGVYIDLDMRCHQPLLTSLSNIPCFLDKEREHQSSHLHRRALTVMNSAMGCRPGHPFFSMVVEFVFSDDTLNSTVPFPTVVLETTGPFMLTRLYERWNASNSTPPVTLLGETYFSPKLDPGIPAKCRRVVRALGQRRTKLSRVQTSCLMLSKLGFEKSDDLFMTSRTVAVHQFTHLGYKDQRTKTFDMLKVFPCALIYDDLRVLFKTAENVTEEWTSTW